MLKNYSLGLCFEWKKRLISITSFDKITELVHGVFKHLFIWKINYSKVSPSRFSKTRTMYCKYTSFVQ